MTGTELIQAVRDLLGEDTAAAFTDALILRQVNHAMRYLYTKITEQNENYFATTATINVTSGTERYALPTASRILYIERTDLEEDVIVPFIDLSQRWEYLQADAAVEDSMVIYLLGNQVGILPVPTATVTGLLRVYYVPPVTALVAGTSPPTEWSTDHHEVIAWEAFKRIRVRDKEALAEISPVCDKLERALLDATAMRESQQPQMIVHTDGEW